MSHDPTREQIERRIDIVAATAAMEDSLACDIARTGASRSDVMVAWRHLADALQDTEAHALSQMGMCPLCGNYAGGLHEICGGCWVRLRPFSMNVAHAHIQWRAPSHTSFWGYVSPHFSLAQTPGPSSQQGTTPTRVSHGEPRTHNHGKKGHGEPRSHVREVTRKEGAESQQDDGVSGE